MGWISDIVNIPTQILCTVDGHDYVRIEGRLICSFCGHRPGR